MQFSTHAEAQAAFSSPEAIFSNRFVKVFWKQPEETQAPTSIPQTPLNNTPSQSAASSPVIDVAKQEKIARLLALQKQKEMITQKQVEYQKTLMAQLENPALAQAERDKIQNILTTITDSLKTEKEDVVDPELQAKLNELKKQAFANGIDPNAVVNSRGRGRGRGLRGASRGGATPRSFKLDNRPARILVKGDFGTDQEVFTTHFKVLFK